MPTLVSATNTNDFWDSVFTSDVATPPAPAVEPVATPAEPATPVAQTGRFVQPGEAVDLAFGDASATPATPTPAVVDPVEPEPTEPAESVTPPVTSPAEPTPVPEPSDEDYTNQVLKSVAKSLIKKGIWQDVEGLDEMTLTEDDLQELAQMQIQEQMGLAWNSVKQTSPVVEGILSVIEAGGNPDSIIDLFKEQQSVSQLDTTTPAGKLQLIDKFNQEVVGLSKQQSQAKIKRLELGSDEDIQAEFDIAQEKYGDYFQKEQARIQGEEKARTDAVAKQKQERIQATVSQLKSSSLHQKTAQKLLSDMYQPKWDMQDGTDPISEFDYQLLKLRNDPAKSIDLARFILDPDNYKKSLTQTEVNKTVDDTFGKLKFSPKSKAAAPAAPSAPKSTTGPDLKSLWG